MDKLTIQFAAIYAKLNSLKTALNDEQLALYNATMEKSKTKCLSNVKEPTPALLKLIDELFQ